MKSLKLNGLLNIAKNGTVRNGVLFSFFSFLNSGISFILLTIIARYLNPDSYGVINLFNTCVGIISIFICLYSSGLISINYFKKDEIEFKRTINTVLAITTVCFCFLLLVVLLFGSNIEKFAGINKQYLAIAVSVSAFTVVNNTNLEIWRIEEKVISYGIFSTSIALLNFILTILFITQLNLDWEGRVWAQVLTTVLMAVLSLFRLIRNGYISRVKPTSDSIKEALSFGIPLIPHGASSWMRQGFDRMYINAFHSASLVGIYSFSLTFANIIEIIGSAFNNTNSVYIYKNLSSDDPNVQKRLRKQTLLMIAFFAFVSIAVCVGASALIYLWFDKYIDSIKYLPILCLSGFFRSVYYLFVNFIFYYKKTQYLMIITFGSSLLHTILSMILTRYSLYYTALITLFIDMIITTFVFIYSRKLYKMI